MDQPRATPFERDDALIRRRPRQARAEQTVEHIKRAMLQIIEEDGYAAASTNRIAERAGVNIASLYRYFPNRPSIALAIYESASAGLARLVHDWLIANITAPMETELSKLVILVVDYFDREQVALLRLRHEVPELREGAQPMSLETLAYHPSRLYFEQQLGPMDKATASRRLFFVQNLGMSMIRQFVLARPPGLSKAQFVDELALLIIIYLKSMPTAKTAVRR